MTSQLPSEIYQQRVDNNQLRFDNKQFDVLRHLDTVFKQLVIRKKVRASYAGQVRRKIKPRQPITGLYLWGSVGTGKTQLMDLFYNHIPVKKMRCHFHAFMRDLHHQLRDRQGEANPLKLIAKTIADEHLLICFDEFFVTNITDAMLLGELFKYLFQGGVCLVTTSNIAPKNLYLDGLQRERFLPTIKLIQQFTITHHLDSNDDYRLQHIKQAGVYHYPLTPSSQENLEISFTHYAKGNEVSSAAVLINDREIPIIKSAGDVIWFDFKSICNPPRSQIDYLALCDRYSTIIISDVTQLSENQTNTAILFIKLVDVLYDTGTKLIISAETEAEQLYSKGRVTFAFQRTVSRLIEMNTEAYFTQ